MRKNASCETRCAAAPTVAYVIDQSTDNPRWRHNSSKTSSSSAVSRAQSSTKLGCETEMGCLPGMAGGADPGAEGRVGAERRVRVLWSGSAWGDRWLSHTHGANSTV